MLGNGAFDTFKFESILVCISVRRSKNYAGLNSMRWRAWDDERRYRKLLSKKGIGIAEFRWPRKLNLICEIREAVPNDNWVAGHGRMANNLVIARMNFQLTLCPSFRG